MTLQLNVTVRGREVLSSKRINKERDENFHLKEQRPSKILILRELSNRDYDSKNGEMQTKVFNFSC